MEKMNLGCYEVAWVSWIKGLLMGILLMLLCGCGLQYQYSTLNTAGYADGIYRSNDYVIQVNDSTKVDTISSLFQLRRKLRTDFNFRWDFAQYAMNQPYSFYWNNPRLDGIWRPYNRFDVYFNSHLFWTNWAWDYPYHYGWNYYGWNRPSYWGWYNRPYNMWGSYNHYNHPYHQNNIAYVRGPRSSRVYQNRENDLNNIINRIENEYNVKPRVYNNPNNIPNDVSNRIRLKPDGTNVNYNIPRNNNSRPVIINNNNNVRPSRPTYNSRPPVNNNSSNISRGSSSSVRSSGGSSSGGSSRGRGNN